MISFIFFLKPFPTKGLLVEGCYIMLCLAPAAVVLLDALLPLIVHLIFALSLCFRVVPSEALALTEALLVISFSALGTLLAFLPRSWSMC